MVIFMYNIIQLSSTTLKEKKHFACNYSKYLLLYGNDKIGY